MFSRSVSRDDGGKVAWWLHSHVRAVIVFCNLIHCFATFSLTFPSSLLKLSNVCDDVTIQE